MCRWLAYHGGPIIVERALYSPAHSLIDQSLHSRLGAETTNGDGFGVGWYGDDGTAALFRGVGPAWSDGNLRELAHATTSPLFLAHVRAAMGGTISRENCHPFAYGRWLWQYNGEIEDFEGGTAKGDRD